MSGESQTKHGTSWSTIVSQSLKTKVPPSRSRFDISGNKESYSVETLFEEAEVAEYLRSQRVQAIVQTAIEPGAVIFSVSSRLFQHQSEALRLVINQIGPVENNYFNPISLRGTRSRGDLVFYTKFCAREHTQKALETGFTHDGIQFTAVPYKDKTDANDYCRVNLTLPVSGGLDCSMDPEIGPNTNKFNLDTEAKSSGTKIFIKKTAWIAAKSLADQPAINRLTRHDVLFQLRQLRTKFHHSSTYLCCRASNEETDDLMAKPYMILTLADFDNSHEYALYRIASQLFQLIATSIFNDRRLAKDSVLDLFARAKQDTDIHRHLESIVTLFDIEVN